MEFSKFNIWAQDHPEKGDALVYNSRTQALIRLDNGFKQDLVRFMGTPGVPASGRVAESLAGLMQNGILVTDKEEEAAKTRDFFRALKAGTRRLPFEVTLLTTYACNFRCVYCFEESVKEGVLLDDKTARQAVDWIMARIREAGLTGVFVVFYGGEPMLNTRAIYLVAELLTKASWQAGVTFGCGMITNGSLLTPEFVNRMVPLGLKELRVTLDGDRAAHDAKRPFTDGRPSFDLIVRNLKDIADKVAVQICSNVDRANLGSLPRLVDLLETEGLLHKIKSLEFAPIMPRLGPKDRPGAVELRECLPLVEDEALFRDLLAVRREVLRRGVGFRSGLAINACPLIMRDLGVTIDPLGRIYACNSLVGYPDFSVGHVQDAPASARHTAFQDIDAWKKCPADCSYLPLCQGGCRFFSYLENGNFSGLACKRAYLDRVIPELIKLEYDMLHAKASAAAAP
ncbi:MAG: radical SAM protein [Deltaproteobacteria bacterium]